jgi:K+/H+ antiporter YhaU regulatory subunit KhtT
MTVILSAGVTRLSGCDAKVETGTPAVEKKETTIVNPAPEKKVENNTTIVNPSPDKK